MTSARRWSIEQDLRSDAERIFVPAEQLAAAQLGDGVDVRSPATGTTSRGLVIERIADGTRGEFFVVRIDEPASPPAR